MFKEPEDGSVVIGTRWYQDSADVWLIRDQFLWRRDDAEGHCDPQDDPEHWWSYTAESWISWGTLWRTANSSRLRLTASTGFAPVEEVEQPEFVQTYEVRPRQGGRRQLQCFREVADGLEDAAFYAGGAKTGSGRTMLHYARRVREIAAGNHESCDSHD